MNGLVNTLCASRCSSSEEEHYIRGMCQLELPCILALYGALFSQVFVPSRTGTYQYPALVALIVFVSSNEDHTCSEQQNSLQPSQANPQPTIGRSYVSKTSYSIIVMYNLSTLYILIISTSRAKSSIWRARATPSAGAWFCPPTGAPHSGHRACSIGIPHSPTVNGCPSTHVYQ